MKFLLNLATLVLIVLTMIFVVIPLWNILDGDYRGDGGNAIVLNFIAAGVLSVPWGFLLSARKAYKIHNSWRRR